MTSERKTMKSCGTFIAPEVWQAMKSICEAQNLPLSATVRDLIANYTREAKEAQEGHSSTSLAEINRRAEARRDLAIRFMVDADEWQAFQDVCRAQGLKNARVLQALFEVFAEKHK